MENKQIEVSVIIATYNCCGYVRDAVESVLTQSLDNYEIIIVDDGSTDETRQVLEPYLERADIRYHFQPNAGISRARNWGIEMAKGKYVLILDADDILSLIHI